MANINWEEAEKSAGGNFLPMECGTFEVIADEVDLRETKNAQGNTTYWLDIYFKDSETNSFPKISHAISFKNDNWRVVHFMRMLKELGIPEDKAKQAIQNCESKSGQSNIVATYESTFERAVAKHPTVKIEVYESDNINPNNGRPYMRADFKNPQIAFGRGNSTPKPETVSPSSIADEGEEIDLTDVPF